MQGVSTWPLRLLSCGPSVYRKSWAPFFSSLRLACRKFIISLLIISLIIKKNYLLTVGIFLCNIFPGAFGIFLLSTYSLKPNVHNIKAQREKKRLCFVSRCKRSHKLVIYYITLYRQIDDFLIIFIYARCKRSHSLVMYFINLHQVINENLNPY